jgi:hypothetical protein
MKKRDEFDSAGEARGYISLDQAVHQALRIAKQDEGRYVQRLGWDEIVWTEASSEQSEDYYKVVLRFNQPTRHSSEEDTGEEEFRFDLTGSLEVRQVRVWPKGAVSEEDEPPHPRPSLSKSKTCCPPGRRFSASCARSLAYQKRDRSFIWISSFFDPMSV